MFRKVRQPGPGRTIMVSLVLVVAVVFLGGCDLLQIFNPKTNTVTYNGNGNTGGTAPVDADTYRNDDIVTVAGPGTLVRSGYAFAGWNTTADGTGTTRAAGTTFAMSAGNVTLFALWTMLPTYTVTYNGNGSTDGVVPADVNSYREGDIVTVAGPGTLVRSGYAFAGWNTAADGTGTTRAAGTTFAMSAGNVTLFATWRELAVHVVGYTSGATPQGGYWVNGVPTSLDSLAGTLPAQITFQNGNRYIYGTTSTGVTRFWKNEDKTELPDSKLSFLPIGMFGFGNSLILEHEGDVLLLARKKEGSVYQEGYYRNSSWNALPVPSSGTSITPSAIAVSDGKVIIPSTCQSASEPVGYFVDSVWHPLPLPAGVEGWSFMTPGITVAGTDVYIYTAIVKSDSSLTKYGYWKNDVWQEICSVPELVIPSGLDFIGTDMILSATFWNITSGFPQAKYWYKSEWHPLSSAPFSLVTSMKVHDSDMYFSVIVRNGSTITGGYVQNSTWNALGDNIIVTSLALK